MVRGQVTYSCGTDLVLVGETMATCSLPKLQWIPSSDDIMCLRPPLGSYISYYAAQNVLFTNKSSLLIDQSDSSSLSGTEAVVITAVVCVVCSFTAGLLLGVLVTLCNVHYHKKQKRDQTERPPVYEDIPLEKKRTDIELQHNEAYGHFPR